MRPSASELLKNPVFDTLRFKDLEKSSKIKINLEVDSEYFHNYEDESNEIDFNKIEKLLSIIRFEADKTHQEHLYNI